MFRSPLEILSEPDSYPFECTSYDVEEAYPTLELLDSDHEEDSGIETERTLSTLFTLYIAVALTCKF